VFLAAFVVFLLPASNIYADTAPFFIGGVSIKPYQESNIVLSKENLTITFNKSDDPRNSTASVNAQFIFVNTGDRVSLKVGFPFSLASRPGFDTTSTLESLKVKVKVDGNQLHPRLLRRVSRENMLRSSILTSLLIRMKRKKFRLAMRGRQLGAISYMS